MLFGWHRFPLGSVVKVTLRISANELTIDGHAVGRATIQVALDPSMLGRLNEGNESPELQVELAYDSDLVRGLVRLNDLFTVLELLQERCPIEPALPSTSPTAPALGLGGAPHAPRSVRYSTNRCV
jgi:hypothetical protein